MKNILVSLDFEEKDQKILDQAALIASKFGSKLWLIHISAPHPEFVGYEVGPQYIRDFRAEELRQEHRMIQDYAKVLDKKNIKADGMLIQGPTVEMILEEAHKLDVDLIVMGSHRHGFLYNMFFADTCAEVIRKSDIPLLVVPLDNG